MKKAILATLLFTSALFAQMEGLKISPSYESAVKEAKINKKNIMLFIYATHCPWCKKMKKTTLSDENVIKYINRKYIFVMANQDTDKLEERFVKGFVPMIYILDHETDEIVYEVQGFKRSETLISTLDDCIP
jgi:thioredoxin-related protein